MSILIIGSEGSMGKRYQAILKYLGQSYKCADLIHDENWVDKIASSSTAIIIATPTNTHLKMIRKFSSIPGKNIPILCEKPLVNNKKELKELLYEVKSKKIKLRMMYQYQMLDNMSANGQSSYNYFRHGKDGLIWDCMQIISLARGGVDILESSPIWNCKLNGEELNLSDMDKAYVDYIKFWFNYPEQDISYLSDIHLKTIEFDQRNKVGSH